MYTLYYSPGACSLAVHATLEELGVRFKAQECRIQDGKTATSDFLSINPKARVPVLAHDGHIVTEATAFLTYLAEKHRQPALIPENATIAHARCLEWLSYLSSTLHPLYWGIWRPHRLSSDKAAYAIIYQTTAARLQDEYAFIDARLGYGRYLLGEWLSIADFYFLVFALWARRIGLPVAGWPNITTFLDTMLLRPSVQRALETEGLTSRGERAA